ncbi:MAG: ABC transporter permease [Bacteroidia bacterium]|nr:ABC transporter permease [Bacteroidia bacterium]
MQKLLFNLDLAKDSILANKTRAMLTALGIIFGVAAVISMLAIGNGAQQEILNQIKLVGVNNIVINPIVKSKEERPNGKSGKRDKKKFSPGLSLQDAKSLIEVIPSVKMVSPEVVYETFAVRSGVMGDVKLVGINSTFFDLYSFKLGKGRRFSESQAIAGKAVCIIGNRVKSKFFNRENPLGKWIKCGEIWLKVIGVLKSKEISETAIKNLNIRDYNKDIYVPVKTMLIRFKNRALVSNLKASNNRNDDESKEVRSKNYHQLDKLVVQVKETSFLASTTEVISRMLKRRHYGVQDFEITVPEMQLKAQQKTKEIFNVVLGAIAGISLVVGGIGIMNIMLASVLERIKEIGIRMSVGARKEDIVFQFLTESVLISLAGGLIGVILGVVLAYAVEHVFEIKTIVTSASVIIAFGVSAAVGLVFGIMPAKRAAEQDPVVSLRHE